MLPVVPNVVPTRKVGQMAGKAANGAGGISRDKQRSRPGAAVWRVTITRPDGRRRAVRVAGTQRDAMAKRDELQREAAATGLGNVRRSGEAWTVGAWLDYWLARVVGGRQGRQGHGTLSASSKRREAWATAEIRKALGGISLHRLTAEHVEQFLAERAEGIGVERRAWSAASCRDVRNLLARALDEAIERGHAPAPNKARTVKHMPSAARRAEARYALTQHEAGRLLRAAMHEGSAPSLVIAVQLATGMRPGEVMALRWADVDLDAATLSVRQAKTPTGVRDMHLAPQAVAALRRAAMLGPRSASSCVFPAPKAVHVTERALIATLTALCEAEGITVDEAEPRVPHPHELRHTWATLMLSRDGANPARIAAMLGDKLETVLRVYHHVLAGTRGEREVDEVAAIFATANAEVA